MTGKKKKVDFSVKPRAVKGELPPTPEEWVKEGKGETEEQEPAVQAGKEKRLTLNLPADLHTAFKGRCVFEGITIQDKVRVLIERELARAGQGQPAEVRLSGTPATSN